MTITILSMKIILKNLLKSNDNDDDYNVGYKMREIRNAQMQESNLNV